MRRQAKRRPSRGVGDEMQKRWESIVARERRYEEGVDKLREARPGRMSRRAWTAWTACEIFLKSGPKKGRRWQLRSHHVPA